jgi:peroxiredoxin
VLTLVLRHEFKQPSDSLVNAVLEDNAYRQYILKKTAAEREFRKGMAAPDFSLENDKGEKVTLQDYKGKVVFIDFWFAACMPCQQMFERLKPLKAKYAGNKDLVFLCVSIDEKGVWMKAKDKVQAEHLYTDNKGRYHPVLKDYNIDGYPTAYIIGKDGLIFDEAPSGFPEQLQSQLEAALKK